MKRGRFAFATLALVAAVTCLAQFSLNGFDPFKAAKDAGTFVKGVAGIGLKEENSIGGAVAIEIVARFGGVWKDAAATRRVCCCSSRSHVCRWLLRPMRRRPVLSLI